MKSTNLIGYDLDGVICEKSPKRDKPFFKQNATERQNYLEKRLKHCYTAKLKFTPTKNFIIITARKTYPEIIATLVWLKNNNLKPKAIYFLNGKKTKENIIKFKAKIINYNQLKEYYDDDAEICKKLNKLCKNTKIIYVA